MLIFDTNPDIVEDHFNYENYMPHGTADNIREENMVQNCKLCKFSLESNRTDTAGVVLLLCRRYPPSIVQFENGMMLEQSAWPTIRFNAWCGEFKFAKTP